MSKTVNRFVLSLAAITFAMPLAWPALSASSIAPSASFVEDRDGESALDLEDYSRAENIFRSRLNGKNISASEEGYLRTGLAESLLWQGRFSECSKEFKKAYSLINKTEPAASDLRARILDDMGWLAEWQGDRAGAIDYCKKALGALQGVLGPEPAHLSGLLDHLGYLMSSGGFYAEAQGYYRQALQLAVTKYGAESLPAADIKEKLASAERRLGNAGDASNLYAQAMQVKLNNPAIFMPYTPHTYVQSVVYRYYPGTPNCSLQNRNGYPVQAVNIGGVTVAASLSPPTKEMPKTCAVNLDVINQSQYPVQVLSKAPLLTIIDPKPAVCHVVDPSKVADTVENKGNRSAKWVRFWGADATTPVTTTMIGNGGYWGYPPVYSYNYMPPVINRSGNMTTITTQVPDYAKQARALQKAADLEQTAREQAEAIRSSSLGPTMLQPGARTSGALYFDASQVTKSYLQVPVGNALVEFEFPPQN